MKDCPRHNTLLKWFTVFSVWLNHRQGTHRCSQYAVRCCRMGRIEFQSNRLQQRQQQRNGKNWREQFHSPRKDDHVVGVVVFVVADVVYYRWLWLSFCFACLCEDRAFDTRRKTTKWSKHLNKTFSSHSASSVFRVFGCVPFPFCHSACPDRLRNRIIFHIVFHGSVRNRKQKPIP